MYYLKRCVEDLKNQEVILKNFPNFRKKTLSTFSQKKNLAFNLNMLLLLSLVKEDNSRISATNKKDLGIIMLAMQTQERF